MKYLFGMFVLFATQIFAQSSHVASFGIEWILCQDVIYNRAIYTDKLKIVEGFSRVSGGDELGHAVKSFDGKYYYLAEEVAGKIIRLRFAQSIQREDGPHWFWNSSLSFRGNYSFLAADDMQALILERDALDEAGMKTLQFKLVDLIANSIRTILTVKDPDRKLFAVAIVKDGDFFIFINNGSVYQTNDRTTSIKNIDTAFWQNLSNKFINSVETEPGVKIQQLPYFMASPFLSKDGLLLIPMKIRELNTWSSASIRELFDKLSTAEKAALIESKKWPLKNDTFEGSEYVFALVSFDPEMHKFTQISSKNLTSLIKLDGNTGQSQLSSESGNQS